MFALLISFLLLPLVNASPSPIVKPEVRVDVKAGIIGEGIYPRATYINGKSLLGFSAATLLYRYQIDPAAKACL